MRAREQAEKEAKKHIDRLNELMQKRISKEKKFEESVEENKADRIFR